MEVKAAATVEITIGKQTLKLTKEEAMALRDQINALFPLPIVIEKSEPSRSVTWPVPQWIDPVLPPKNPFRHDIWCGTIADKSPPAVTMN